MGIHWDLSKRMTWLNLHFKTMTVAYELKDSRVQGQEKVASGLVLGLAIDKLMNDGDLNRGRHRSGGGCILDILNVELI